MTQVAGLILLVFGLLPIANWIPGGHEAPWYHDRLGEWLSGGAIVLGVGVIAALVLQRRSALWNRGAWARLAGRWRSGDRLADASIAALSTLCCIVVARLVLSAKPLLIDEIISDLQARIFASGHLFARAADHPEFSSSMHLLDWNGKVYGQFPAGGPAMLMLGVLIHAEWLVGPIATGLGAFCFGRLMRLLPLRDGTALASLLLYSLAPFTLFLGGSMMNHVTATAWLIGAALALAHATRDETAHPRAAFAMGLAFGIAATIRPTDAAAFAIPAAVWLLIRARRGSSHILALLASGIGVAIPVAALLYINHQQTGSALRFGYIEMWGRSHEIGFHPAPWGPAHTPARGLELINLYLLRLQDYLFESAGPGLMFASIALLLVRRIEAFDRWIVASCGLLLLAYFAYWHDGFYLGPRFMLPLAPWLALWTARLPVVLESRRIAAPIVRGTVVAGVTSLLIGAAVAVPIRARQYRNGMLSMRFDIDSAARANGVYNAYVLVRESWGAQLVARLWALGVPRAEAEHLYRSNDACVLQHTISAVELAHGRAPDLERAMLPYSGDSARLMTDHHLPDTTVRFLPGRALDTVCIKRLREDIAGFTPFPPVLLHRDTNVIYLRDLHDRDSLIIRPPITRSIWLLTQAPEIGGQLRFERVLMDSMFYDWHHD